jgi:hypothetical protein
MLHVSHLIPALHTLLRFTRKSSGPPPPGQAKKVMLRRIFSFAEYPVAPGLRSRRDCFGGVGRYGDEGVENPP